MIKFIKAVNLQSLKTVTLFFPETGIVRLAGPNSNGKSILRKALTSIIQCRLNVASVRKALIRRTERSAQCAIGLYNGDVLDVHISLEASGTYYELMKVGKPPVRRYLLDKGLDLLVNDFGLHYSEKRGFSLNVCNLREPLFMIGTNGASNLEQLDTIATDYRASQAVNNLSESVKELTVYSEKLAIQKQAAEIALGSLKIYDIEAERDRLHRLTWLADNIENFKVPEPVSVEPVTEVDFLDLLTPPNIPEVEPCTDLKNLLSINVPDVPDVLPDADIACLESLAVESVKLQLDDSVVYECCVLSRAVEFPKVPELKRVAEVAYSYHELLHALQTGVCPTCGKELIDVPSAVCQRPA